MTTARRLALDVLRRIEDEGAFANLALGPALERSDLSAADRRFATDLVYGTTRMRRACDALVDRFITTPPDPATRRLLRLGAYQLAFGGVPPHAAVSMTVGLAPKRVRGFANAVLRKVAQHEMVWPSEFTRLSYPDWIGELLVEELGRDDAIEAMARMNVAPPVTVRPDGYVQDRSSQWVASAVGAGPGVDVLDVCAAPGGKATALSATGARVTAVDVRAGRVSLVARNAERLGLAVACVVADGTAPPFVPESFDAVLLDAPCSGLGALRRRADARWRVRRSQIDELVDLQRDLLRTSAGLVRPGGRLVYSVCTLTAAESIDHPIPEGFELDGDEPPGTWRRFGSGWRILPQDADTDGMTMVRYRRSS